MKNDKTGSWEEGGPCSWGRIPQRAIIWGESLGDLGMATSRKEQWAQQQRTQMKQSVCTGRALWIKWYQGGGTEWEKLLTDKCIPQRAGGHGDNLVFYSWCDGKPCGTGVVSRGASLKPTTAIASSTDYRADQLGFSWNKTGERRWCRGQR